MPDRSGLARRNDDESATAYLGTARLILAVASCPLLCDPLSLGFARLGIIPGYKGTMQIQSRYILTISALAFALASGLPTQVSADELKEAKVTQVIQDVRVLPSNASPRPAALNDDVRHGTAVQTGVQSRSELTFKDQTITRLGEKTIFSVGEGSRSIDLGKGQFLLYAPKKAGGAKVKMGPVTAAISG